jgi:hypothetical protein
MRRTSTTSTTNARRTRRTRRTAVSPADAIFAFAGWLTSRGERVGPFSRYDDAAPMARLAGAFCDFQGWEVSEQYPYTFAMPPDGGLHPKVERWPAEAGGARGEEDMR